jgi:MFS transporter, DHA2 family, multidrug resistance protein
MNAAPKSHPPVHRHLELKPAAAWHPRHNRWAIALCITIATFMEVLDTSIANVALPHIAGGLGATLDESTWVLTSYLVANAIVLPISAWLATVFGRKRLYMSCVAVFTLSSMICGLATSLWMLIIFRVAQGAGGGGLGPSEQGILADTFAPEERGMAFAIYGMAVILAPAIGPALGGWITDHHNWRWLFFINVPAGVLSLLLTYRMIEDPPYLVRQRKMVWRRGLRVDFTGLVLVATFLGPLQIMLDRGEEANWFGSQLIVTLALVWTFSLAALIFRELNHKRPVVNLRLFRNRTFAISTLLMFVLGFVLYGSIVLLPQYVQVMLGWSAQSAGMVLSPGGFTLMLLMPIAGLLVARFDARWLIAIGFATCVAALYHMTIIDQQIDYFNAMMLRIYMAIGVAFLFVPINTMAYTGVAAEHNDDVSSMINLARNIGGSVGIALSSALVTERAQFHQATLVAHATAYDGPLRIFASQVTGHLHQHGLGASHAVSQTYARLYQAMQAQSATLAYIDAFYMMAVLSACMIPLVFLMKRSEPGRGMVLG